MAVGPYAFWLLDLDGTIVDVEAEYRRRVIDGIASRLGTAFSPPEVETLWSGRAADRGAVLAAHGVSPTAFWRAYHAVERPVDRANATYRFPDADVVNGLDGPVGIVTHCQRYLTEPVLDRLDMNNWFDAVVCCTDETGWKPDPAPIELAMERLSIDGAGSAGAYVGDSPDDMAAAQAAGLDAVYLDRGDGAKAPDATHRITGLWALTGTQ